MKIKKIEIQPLITEKSMQASASDVYTFLVPPKINRVEIAKILKEIYKVTPISVNTINLRGKVKSFRKFKGKRADFKKAFVKLKKGEKIPGFEVEKPKGEKEKKAKNG